MKTHLVPAFRIYLGLTVVLGFIYPLMMTGMSQVLFKREANGSLVERDGKILGSSLIAQKFESDRYFKSRPSAIDYNPLPSGGSNLGPTAQKLKEASEQNKAKYRSKTQEEPVPQDLIFTSGSGLDPHISPEAALFQVDKVAVARNLNEEERTRLRQLVADHVEKPDLGFLGEKRVNVLKLNLALELK